MEIYFKKETKSEAFETDILSIHSVNTRRLYKPGNILIFAGGKNWIKFDFFELEVLDTNDYN